ncbi:MAG: hypothetical protein IT448_03025 [Phycisphaerales bacterium]|nr:hypothetical protein [Phycisphaerales bacterium]
MSFSTLLRSAAFWAVGFVGVPALLVNTARAEDYLVQGVQAAAAEMPHVTALMRRPVAGQSPDQITPLWTEQYDPITDANVLEYGFAAYLDTGTSGVLLSREIQEILGINLQLDSGGNPSKFSDVTIDGSKTFNIAEPLYISVAPYPPVSEPPLSDLAAINQLYTAPRLVRPYVSADYAPTDALGEIQERTIVGMPGLIGKSMLVDSRAYNHVNEYLQQDENFIPYLMTSVHAPNDPVLPAADYTIRLSYSHFDDLTDTTPDEAGVEPPTLAHNPFIGRDPRVGPAAGDPAGVRIARTGGSGTYYESTGNWLLDTGAQVSFMSSVQAANLGYSLGELIPGIPVVYDDNGEMDLSTFYVPISGADAGSVALLPGIILDELVLPALEGDIIYRDLPILIVDVTIADMLGNTMLLDGDIGMNLFLPSHDAEGNNLVSSAFDYFIFDESAGELRLVSVPEPALGTLTMALLCLVGRRGRRVA